MCFSIFFLYIYMYTMLLDNASDLTRFIGHVWIILLVESVHTVNTWRWILVLH